MLRIKKKDPMPIIIPALALTLTEDPPPQPPKRKLEDIPLFMRKQMPMDFPDNSHLPDFENAIEEIFDGTPAEIALRFKEKGNQHFKARRWWDARESYIEGIEFWPEDDKLMEVLWLNVAAANIELGHWPGVLHGAAEAITLNLKSSKGYYRAARGLIHYGRYEEAIDCCKRVVAYDPDNEAIKTLLDDPRLGGAGSTETKTKEIRLALETAYEHHNLVIILNKAVAPTIDNFPFLSPALPEDPTKADLYCNVTLKYIERNALDVLVGVKTDYTVGHLLERCLPGHPLPDRWNKNVSFDPNITTKQQVQRLKQQLASTEEKTGDQHPAWDPDDDYLPSKVALYIETYSRQIIEVSPENTLAQTFESSPKSSPSGIDGVCLEQGSIFIHVFRRGSKVERLWKEGKGRKGFALTQHKYRKDTKEGMLAAGQLRTHIIDAPRDHLVELSIAARRDILAGPNVHFGRKE